MGRENTTIDICIPAVCSIVAALICSCSNGFRQVTYENKPVESDLVGRWCPSQAPHAQTGSSSKAHVVLNLKKDLTCKVVDIEVVDVGDDDVEVMRACRGEGTWMIQKRGGRTSGLRENWDVVITLSACPVDMRFSVGTIRGELALEYMIDPGFLPDILFERVAD